MSVKMTGRAGDGLRAKGTLAADAGKRLDTPGSANASDRTESSRQDEGLPNAADCPVPEVLPVDWLALKQAIVDAAPSLGIDKIGFATADPFLELKDMLVRRRTEGLDSGFEEPDLDKRIDPALSLTGARSIIAIAVAYPAKLPDPPRAAPGATRGILARSAWGEDYHVALRRRLAALAAFIRERVPHARMESMVDTGALSDRAAALRAGIGYAGKNGSVITPEFGSWVYLGELLTDLPFPPDTPITEECGECTLCLDACPTNAFIRPGELDAKRCISFLTQTKDPIADELKEKMGNRIYGCDTCQVVCPKNKGYNWSHHPELVPDPETAKPLLASLLTISNREFKDKFGSTSAAWRGKKPLQRNALIALGRLKDQSAVKLLRELLGSDPRPDIRESASWALGRIGGDEALKVLEEALLIERDPAVLVELNKAMMKASLPTAETD